MSKQSLDQVLQRASTDARFRASLGDNFDGALRSYDLSSDEKAQLARGLGISAAAATRPMAPAVAANIDAGSVSANTVDSNTVDANTVDANTVDANTIDANTIDANTIDANTIDANTVDANTIDVSSLDQLKL